MSGISAITAIINQAAEQVASTARLALTPPASGQVRLYTADAVFVAIRNGEVDRSGGVGGWQQSARVLRPDADWWKNTPKDIAGIPLMLDIDELPGAPLEQRLTALRSMGQPDESGQPPAVSVDGDAPMCAGIAWKIDDVALGAALYRPDAPTRLRRVELTVQLSSLDEADAVEKVTVKRTRSSATKRRRRVIHSRQGDTLRAIAVRQLGSSGQYTKIREWNPKLKKIDPDAPLRVNTKVVLK